MTITLDLDALEAGLDGVTPGPWVTETAAHPYRDGSHSHQEQLVVTAWDHPQLGAPIGIVRLAIGVGLDGQAPIPMLRMEPADQAHIARCSPEPIVELIRLARIGKAVEAARTPRRNSARSSQDRRGVMRPMQRAQQLKKLGAALGREGMSKRVISAVSEFQEDGSYKGAMILVGRLKAIAAMARADEYWAEQVRKGEAIEACAGASPRPKTGGE